MRVVLSLFFCILCCSATNSLESRLDRQLRTWQKRLGLEDWNLRVQVVRQSEIDHDSWGAAEWDSENQTGIISVLDPRDYNLKGGELKVDMECTIVHELVHIAVAPLDAHNQQTREEVVNKIMGALMPRPCPN